MAVDSDTIWTIIIVAIVLAAFGKELTNGSNQKTPVYPPNPDSPTKVPAQESPTVEPLAMNLDEAPSSAPKHKGIGRWLFLLVLSLAALAFAWFIWPTRYRYDRMDFPNGISWPVLLTGSQKTQASYARSWLG